MGVEEGGLQNRGVGGQLKVFQPPFLKGYPFKKGDGKTFYKERVFSHFSCICMSLIWTLGSGN